MKKVFLILLFIAVLAGFLWFVVANRTSTKAASSRKFLLAENANELSFTDAAADSSVFSLQADISYLYKNEHSNTPAETAAAFLADNPSFDTGKKLLAENMLQQTALVKQLADSTDPLLKGHGISGKSSHFLYQQNIGGIPVYGASLSVHIRNDNEVYSISGALATSQSVAGGNITRPQAEEIALVEAGRKIKNPRIASVQEIIFNGKILGLSGDGVNEASWKVNVEGDRDNPFSVHYFVSKIDGRIIYAEDYMRFAKHRNVYDCGGGVDQCPLSRTENDPAVNRDDVDSVYDLTGTVYDYYSTRYSRDSYDNAGAAINSLANLSTQPEAKCPNAFWLGGHTDPTKDILGVCQGLVANDVIAHELSHAVIEKSSPLVYEKQTGAINESLADIFAYGVDPDWQMGEDTTLGVIRDISQPEAMAIAARRQPERLFSPLYYCTGQGSGESCSSANDYCGVHKNGGVIGKGFYLMVAGGSFNGCQISGIGGERALLVMYQMLTRHLQASDNFRAFYAKAILACGELYGAGSATCNEVQKSLQAVEIDQQPENESLAAPCIGQTRQPATCSSATVTDTVTPSPTPSGTPAETPTTTPGTTPTATMTPTPPSNITPTPTTTPIPSGPENVKITLHLPGINTKPSVDKMNFDIYFTDEAGGQKYDFPAREFTADEQGKWTAKLHLDFTAQSRFALYIKGPFHTRKKICDMFPQETYPGTYRCNRGNIILHSGGIAGAQLVNPIDLTGIMLLAGDLQPQNGVITAYDIALVRNNLGSRNPIILRMADVNLDGVIDTADYSLIIASLSIKTDEE